MINGCSKSDYLLRKPPRVTMYVISLYAVTRGSINNTKISALSVFSSHFPMVHWKFYEKREKTRSNTGLK